MKVTIHAAGREQLPELTRNVLGLAGDRSRVQVSSVGVPGVTVDADLAVAFLTGAGTGVKPVEGGGPSPSPPASETGTARATDPAAAEDDGGPRQPRRAGRPRKTTSTAKG